MSVKVIMQKVKYNGLIQSCQNLKGSEVTNNLDRDQAYMVVFQTPCIHIGTLREVKSCYFFLICNFCHSTQLIQILHGWIKMAGRGARGPDPLEKHVIWVSIWNMRMLDPLWNFVEIFIFFEITHWSSVK